MISKERKTKTDKRPTRQAIENELGVSIQLNSQWRTGEPRHRLS